MKHIIKSDQRGQILVALIVILPFFLLMISAYMQFTSSSFYVARRDQFHTNAQLAADAGADYAIMQINASPSWTGASETVLHNETGLKTTYDVAVANNSSTSKTLTVTGHSYAPASSATASASVKLKIDLEAVTSGGNGPSSVVSGVGGLILTNNAKISGGDVVVNGTIAMSNNSQIGLTTNSVNVRVADQVCPQPVDSTYPQICFGGTQPISMGNNAKIYGNVQANNQTNGSNMLNPGLVSSSGVTPQTLPVYDRSSFTVSSTHSSSDSGIACGNNATVNWPANVKITGNITFGNNCTVNLSGNVWITGNLNTGNNSKLVVSNSLGSTRPVVMIDGSGGFTFGNNGKIMPNASGTGVEMRSFWSQNACSPNCSSLTGTNLANSQGVTTINLANNGSANNSVFIAQWSRVTVSNNGGLGAVGGQSVSLGANAVINFTSSVPGSDNRVTTWVKHGYERLYH